MMPDISDSQFRWCLLDEMSEQPNAAWKHWLCDSSSLTQLLIEKSKREFKVEVMAEEWVTVENDSVRSRFGPLPPAHKFWSRKVTLLGNGQPWVLAHTLVPEHSLLSPLKEVLELNEKPLGEYLFAHPDLIRGDMELTAFADNAWGRRSIFHLFRKPVMVAEFFLPALMD